MRPPRSNIEWSSWGARDPLYGVASLAGRNKRGDHPWTDEEFYRYGALNWNEYRRQWESYGVRRRSCVEIGCGAGRITRQLAAYFHEVHAVDVSREMIDYARRHIDLPNVSFHLTGGAALPLADGSVSAAFSCDVFQHFSRVSFAEQYLIELNRVLDAGASLMIHLPVYTWPDTLRRTLSGLYTLRSTLDSLHANTRRLLLTLGFGNPFMFGVSYESKWLYEFLGKVGFREVEIRFFENSGDPGRVGFRSYLFARKPAAPVSRPS
jgi:ubiquinone/menaquinone biosynthesis C-methylase UbiE